jgi:rubrerythrin
MNNKNSEVARRQVIVGMAVTGGTALAISACGPATNNNNDAGMDADVASLNALLAAEYKAIDAYTQGAGVLATDMSDLGKLVLAVAVEFQKDHREHATLLDKTIKALGGTPTAEATNKFTLPTGFVASTTNVMKLACNEERRAAIAYNQVLKGLVNKTNRFIAAAIQGDETQHYVVLAALIEGLAVPTANLTPTMNADKVVPQAFVSNTSAQGGGNGLQSETDFATDDNM